MNHAPTVDEFWAACRAAHPELPDVTPEAWAFGSTREHADSLLALVAAGIKTGTASSLWDYEHTGDPLPYVGLMNVILDSDGIPRALIETTSVEIMPFDQVPEEHAYAEGEGDRTLEAWREIHERFWTHYSDNPRGYEPDMPVVCERFRLIHVDREWAAAHPPE